MMTEQPTTACPITELAHQAADLIDAYTQADRAASSMKSAEAEASRRAIWERLVKTQGLAASHAASDAVGALFQIDVAACALRDVDCDPALASRSDIEMVADLLDRVREFLIAAFPRATDPAEAFFGSRQH